MIRVFRDTRIWNGIQISSNRTSNTVKHLCETAEDIFRSSLFLAHIVCTNYTFLPIHLQLFSGYCLPKTSASWPLTFDLESGVRVTSDVSYLCASFSLPRPLCSRVRPDVRDRQSDRQTSDRRQTKASLNASALWRRRHNNIVLLHRAMGGQLWWALPFWQLGVESYDQ